MAETLTQPYLMFDGRYEETLEFYRTALGAQIDMMMRHKDSPEPLPPGMLRSSNDSQVQMPLEKIFWSPRFGMLTDRFGISWMINVVA
ncbi:putative glyoxalase superfamily protein PhnB [Nitrosomonas sp. Nm84]|uniref:hypothetical protein n=1 Tax=Nitrosomonas sp. Nm84 TaxID=200124 RepID=UPI000D769B58|nr:hypothetical protein [Nitrosomonas sp. Nm84]PXW87766.1 putative glyoxalase superfamily protein PhnB [Nitrosomonas sp. Nm84]